MTHRSDNQSYEDTLHDAVQDMHQQMPRGNHPSSRAWAAFSQEAGIPSQDLKAAQSSTNSPSAPKRRAHKNRTRSSNAGQPSTYLGWSTWLAVALVVVLVGASVNFLMPENNGGNNTSDNSIALAPGTPDFSTLEPLHLASPSSNPEMYVPVHGPEYACQAEPLTANQVFDIVMNPHREFERLGQVDSIAETEKQYDAGTSLNYWRSWFTNPKNFSATTNPEFTEPIVEAANEFWNCLMTGTAFQVWGLMHPYTVQHEILTQYPVLRDEETIRRHIDEWGSRRYSASLYHAFPDLGNVDPANASTIVDETPGQILVQYNVAGNMPISIGEPFSAIIRVTPAFPSTDNALLSYTALLLQRAPNGQWWVTSIYYPD